MNNRQLSRIVLRGFKSIRECDLELRELNVLIGPNGAGKSNFIGFFRMIQQMMTGNLQLYAAKQGGPDALLYFGRKKTVRIRSKLYFGNNGYLFTLESTNDNKLVFENESVLWNISGEKHISSGHFESVIDSSGKHRRICEFVTPALKSWRVYHFHDTSDSALVKQLHGINDNQSLSPDARNLAAYLYFLKQVHPAHYQRIVKTIRLVAPFFDDFSLRPYPLNPDKIELEWTERGEDTPFKAHVLSDGTLRFICLATVLLQPEELQPETILIDEPELGLHPYAIRVLAGLLRSASQVKQVIVSTQSVELLNEFEPEDVIVADRTDQGTALRRLEAAPLAEWLEEYSLGELWKKNLLGGRPAR